MMIKKVLMTGVVAASLALTSCGDGMPKDICDCLEIEVQFMKETADLDFNDEKVTEIQAKYEEQAKICEEISLEYEEKFEDKSQEEVQNELNKCSAYEELQSLVDAQMQKYQEAMQNQQMEMDMNMDLDLDSDTEAETNEEEMLEE